MPLHAQRIVVLNCNIVVFMTNEVPFNNKTYVIRHLVTICEAMGPKICGYDRRECFGHPHFIFIGFEE